MLRRSRRVLAVAGPVVTVGVVGLLALAALREGRTAERLVSHTRDVMSTADAVLARLVDAETGERGYVVSGIEEYLEPYRRAGEDVDSTLGVLRRLTADNPRQQRSVAILDRIARARLRRLDSVIAVRRAAGFEPARAMVVTGRGKILMDSARASLREIKAREGDLLAQRAAAVTAHRRATALVVLAGLLATLGVALFTNRMLARAAERQGETSRQLAEQNEQLQAQAAELELQVEESQALGEELAQTNDSLHARTLEAEGATARLSFLADASARLGASLDYTETLRAVAAAAVPRLADWCAVDVVADPTSREWPPKVERLAIVHQDPSKVAFALAIQERYPQDWNAPGGLPLVLRDGVSVFYPAIGDDMLVAAAIDDEHLRLLRELRFSSLIIAPLVARGLTLGAITLCTTESARRYDAADLALAEDLARRAAVAVDNARLFAEAERARADAEQANRAKSEFLATMSHELRTPLNAIAGYAELIAIGLRGPITDAQRQDLARIRASQQHLLGIITDILTYARIDAGKVELEVTEVRLDGVLDDVWPMIEPQARARDIVFERTACDSSPVACADRERVVQILTNLLANAVKFTPPGGRITVACAADVALAAGRVPRANVALRVADTGIGIAGDKLDAIFEPFTQLDRGLTRTVEGTGLGLAISRDLARQMGGDLTVESTPGQGSSFTLVLPRPDA
ncbi:MAG TPA: CHASE3 domain-containing protein [Gemmatimonadaceae bacterium]|nr:CHASE3 domain-containing protein [Gemmatimonadaceae bacterium]